MTGYTIPIQKDMACASATEKISTVSAEIIAKKINRMSVYEAESFLEKIVDGKVSINSKFHTSAAKAVLILLKSAENNAVSRGLDTKNLAVAAAAHKGPKTFRARRNRGFGTRMKSTHVQIVLKPFVQKKKNESQQN